MVAFNFKKEFADDVESGRKLQTIRQKARAKAGDKLQLYTGMRRPTVWSMMHRIRAAMKDDGKLLAGIVAKAAIKNAEGR